MTGIKMGKKERKMGDITKKIYATCTSPTMHLICPPSQILDKHALFTVSLGTAVIPRRNEKQRVMQNRGGGQIRCIVGDVQVQQQSKNIEKN